jgi:hypothetical protein
VAKIGQAPLQKLPCKRASLRSQLVTIKTVATDIPTGRCFPSAFGMQRRFTGEGRYRPAFRSACIPSRNLVTPVPRWIAAWLGPHPPPLQCSALASTPSTRRHSCRSGHTVCGSAVSYSAWRTPIACIGVVVLCLRGFWPFPSSAPPLQRVVLHAFTGTSSPSDSLPVPLDLSNPALYQRSLPDKAAG